MVSGLGQVRAPYRSAHIFFSSAVPPLVLDAIRSCPLLVGALRSLKEVQTCGHTHSQTNWAHRARRSHVQPQRGTRDGVALAMRCEVTARSREWELHVVAGRLHVREQTAHGS